MTISTTASTVTVAGNGLTTSFSFGFVYADASDIQVAFIAANGSETILVQGSQYTLSLNPPAVGQIWGVGGSVNYPLSGPPIAAGTFLTISRNVPFTQLVSISNQGNFYPQVVEKALDLLEMQIQETSENNRRAITINPADNELPVPLPVAAVRANQYLIFDSNGQPTVGGPINGTLATAFTSIAALRANTAAPTIAIAWVAGYYIGADGGEGMFWFSPADRSSPDNGGTIIVDAGGNRWYRETSGEPYSVLWFGAKGDGATPDAAAFNATLAAAGPNRYAVAPGGRNYLLGSPLAPTEVALLTQGATFVDPGNGIPVWDPSTFITSQSNFGQALSKAGNATPGSANQFGQVIQASVPVTSSPEVYEKAALYVTANTQDPSTYGDGGHTRDMVGIEVHSISNVANPGLGRVWGYHTTVEVAPGTDGNAVGLEIEVQNFGSNDGTVGDVERAKVGINLLADGPVPATAAIVIRDNSSTWNAGIQFLPNSLSPGAQALLVPNTCPISGFDTGLNIRHLILIDGNNEVIIGDPILPFVVSQSTLLPQGDNLLQLGNSANRWASVWAANGAIQTSDPTLKTNIQPLPASLPIVEAISPITFQWKVGGYETSTGADGKQVKTPRPGKRTHWGFSATDVKAAFDKVGMDFAGYVKSDDGTQALRPDQLISVLWKAVQELAAKVATLEAAAVKGATS